MIYPVVFGLIQVFVPCPCFCYSKRRDNWADAEVSKSAATVKKRRKKCPNSADKTDEQPQMALHLESVDTVDNVPIETESSLKQKESCDDSIEELGVVRATSESTVELCLVEGASLERNKADHVPAMSSPIGPEPESTVEPSKEALEEPNYVPSSSHVSGIPVIEKTSLQRVNSVPALASDDQKRQGTDVESIGNFRRSGSLRERGTRKLQELHAVTKARSASDENLKEFERKKKEILGLEEPETSDLQDAKNVGKESSVEGLLPSDLHGVLESGFVKRYSRKFEEGAYNVPELEGGVALTSKEEVDVECAPVEGDKITEEEQDEGMPNEEPEPGVVKKHKEGYELKHRESLKRRALLQQGGSGEMKSAKREGDDIEGALAVDADSKLVQAAGGLEGELRGVNVEALVKKVNQDMKKEVTVRRMSASKKEQELRAYVQKAGEKMENALVDDEEETLQKDKSTLAHEVDSDQISEDSVTGIIKRNTRVFELEEDAQDLPSNDSQLTGTSESRQPVVSKGDTKNATLNIELMKPSVAQNVSASVESAEKSSADIAEASALELEKGTSNEKAKEGRREVDQEVGLSLSKGQTRSAEADTEQENRTISQDESVGTEPTEFTPEKAGTAELLEDKKTEQSEQNSENIPEKGLVKRHTLLIEGKLQPLDQEFQKNVEKLNGQERQLSGNQEASSSLLEGETNGAASHAERTQLNVVQSTNSGVESKEKSSSEIAKTCELSEDGESTESGHDTDNVPPKGLVKRHTLLIEGKIQPLDQELEKKDEKEIGKETERTDDQEVCSSSLKEERSVAIDSQQEELGATQDLRAGVEPLETNASGAKHSSALSEDVEDRGSEEDTENVLQEGLVKRHTLLIEGRLQPLDQELSKDAEKDDGKESDLVLDKEVFLSAEDQGQLRYQIERTSDSEVEQCAEENQDNERVSGLVKREKLRIEERLQTTSVESKQELEQVLACSDNTVLEAVDGEEGCREAIKKEEGDEEIEQIKGEEEQSDVVVDTSSVVKVKEQAQHLEGIIRVTQDGEKVKRQTSKDGDPKSSDDAPKFFIVPRTCSDENINDGNEFNTVEKFSEDRMDVLSDSAVNTALLKAQENLDSEKENLELDNKNLVDWEVANVKQRRQIFEDIVRDFDKNSRKSDEESENKSNSLRRHESMPKMTRATEKPALRRRSVSDVTATVSPGSDCEVGYTIVFRKRVEGSSSSSSLPRDWSPLEHRQRKEDKDESHTEEVFSPEVHRNDKLKSNTSVEFIDRHDTCKGVKETIQVLDSKNQRNISNIS